MLTTIKLKMYGQTRARYEYVQPTDILLQFLSLKQEHAESLVDYTQRFKQGKDNLEATIRVQFLSDFIEKTEKYKSGNSGDKQKLKTEAFAEWTAYVYLKNSDNNKYGMLKKSLQSQYALRNDQYPRTISLTADVMTNHQWDDKYRETDKKRKENSGGGGS